MIDDYLVAAAADRDTDLLALADVDGDELRALLVALPDPDTDGMECDHEEERP
jgi:hypothetical protein